MEIKRIIVGLDLTEMDDQVIRYINFLEEVFDLDTVYFLHVAKDLKLPDRVREKYPDILAPVDESIESDIRKKLDALYKPVNDTEYSIEIKEGDAMKGLMHWTEVKNVDLIVMGRKIEMNGSGKLAAKFARLVLCSMLFVPEGFTPRLDKVVVSVDYSNTSGLALDAALYIREHTPVDIIIHHAYDVPTGYHYTGKTHDEFQEIMGQNALDDAHEFISKRGLDTADFSYNMMYDNEDDPGERAYECATESNAAMIIMSSRGRTGMASLLLGSVAEKMVQYDSKVPLIIIKNKKENLGFFDALMRI